MLDQNWDTFGEEIKNRVDQAIRCSNFTNLSRSIGDIINETIDGIKGNYGSQSGYGGQSGDSYREYYGQTSSQPNHNQTASGPRYQGSTSRESKNNGYGRAATGANRGQARGESAEDRHQPPALYQTVPSGKVSGILMCVGGFSGVTVFGVALIGCSFLTMLGESFLGAVILLAAFTLGFFALAVKGTRKLGLANRFQRYVRLCSRQMYIQIPMLAEKTGRTVGYITKDLKKMIERRMFFQAHIDEEEHCLILSDQAYQEYITAKQSYREQKRKAEEDARTRSELSPECRKLIEDGEAYIKHIHQCNEELSGEEISAKLDHMERVVSRIFSVVQEHPEVAPDLRKLMSYYLPTTKKLLDAYIEMDRQPIEGENISATKKEIESTIDTLNVAFEKLLDGLFVEKAWDISSDISALNTILAQDGLKEDGLKKKKNM